MKAYPYNKKSEAEWIATIPTHWACLKIDSLFSQRKTKVSDKDYAPLSVTKKGIVPQLADAAKSNDSDNRKLVRVGDFVINSRSDRKGSCGVSNLDGSVSLINIVLEPRKDLNNKYIHYLLRSRPFSEEFYRYGRGIVADLWTTRYEEMKNILLPVPPRAEQDQIVRYLDWKISKVNLLINLKKKEIMLISDLRKAYISKIVMQGLVKTVPTRDCGIKWIGRIPSHWDTIRCKYLFNERDERSEDGKEQHFSMSQKYGLIPDSQLDERHMLSESYIGGKICYKNDLVLNRLKAHLGVFALAPEKGIISPDYTVLIPDTNKILPDYAEAVLKSDRCRSELKIRVRGIVEGFWRLYTDDFYTIVLPVPPLDEQSQIIEQIRKFEDETKNYKNCLTREISLLQEYKSKLISDVATGQIDVRDIEVPEYEYVEETADIDSEETDEFEEEDREV